jgi:hypothetical protein
MEIIPTCGYCENYDQGLCDAAHDLLVVDMGFPPLEIRVDERYDATKCPNFEATDEYYEDLARCADEDRYNDVRRGDDYPGTMAA